MFRRIAKCWQLRLIAALASWWLCTPLLHAASVCELANEPKVKLSRGLNIQWGSSNAPLSIELAEGKRYEVTGKSAQPCFIGFSLAIPSLVALTIDMPANAALPSVELQTTSVRPIQPIRGELIQDGSTKLQLRYNLPSTDYALKISTNHDTKGAAMRFALTVNHVKATAPAMPLDGTTEQVFLDPLGRNAVRQFALSERAMVKFSLSNAPDMGTGIRKVTALVKDSDGVAMLMEGSQAHGENSESVQYILPPGRYFLEADGRYNGWPSPVLAEPATTTPIVLRLESLVPYKEPPSMTALIAWMKKAQLDRLLEFIELTDFKQNERNLPDAYERNFEIVTPIAKSRHCKRSPKTCEDRLPSRSSIGSSKRFESANLQWPPESEESDRPQLLLTFRVKQDREVVAETERAFLATYGVPLWDRLLQKISNLESVSARRIVILAPVWCDPGLVYYDGESAWRHGLTCMSASSSVPINMQTLITQTANEKLLNTDIDLATALPKFFAGFLKNTDAKFDYLAEEADFVEVIIRGLKGQVISGGRDWEKLQLTLSLTGKRPRMLRASLDGQLASGLGGYPSDSHFTRDMDVQFKGNATEYCKKLLVELRKFLEGDND